MSPCGHSAHSVPGSQAVNGIHSTRLWVSSLNEFRFPSEQRNPAGSIDPLPSILASGVTPRLATEASLVASGPAQCSPCPKKTNPFPLTAFRALAISPVERVRQGCWPGPAVGAGGPEDHRDRAGQPEGGRGPHRNAVEPAYAGQGSVLSRKAPQQPAGTFFPAPPSQALFFQN